MYNSKREPGRKFGSAFVGKRFDSYEGGEQPKFDATPEEHSGDKVNAADSGDSKKSKSAESDSSPHPSEVVAEHGPAQVVTYHHDHDGGEHKVSSVHEDGHHHESVHSSAAEAYEEGGQLANTDVKEREHPDQQGAESEEKNYAEPEVA